MEELQEEVRSELGKLKLTQNIELVEKGFDKTKISPEGVSTSGVSEEEACSTSAKSEIKPKSTVLFMLGMAGSGKTSFTQRYAAHLMSKSKKPYIINLDPACNDPPYPVNIDIRDTVDYKKVMEQYCLGPNGGIVTSLNLFCTIFDQVLDIVKERAEEHEFILIDTPGQLECFLWSASGQILLQSFAALFPTIIVYISDIISCSNPITFASNMMYGVTILFKNKLPIIITLTKMDLDPEGGKIVRRWISDFEAYEEMLQTRESYSVILASSLTLALEEFYKSASNCIVSSYTGYGMTDFDFCVTNTVQEYNTTYKKMYDDLEKSYRKKKEENQMSNLEKFKKDFQAQNSSSLFSMSGPSDGIDLLFNNDSDTSESSQEEMDQGGSEQEEEDEISSIMKSELTKRKIKRNEK